MFTFRKLLTVREIDGKVNIRVGSEKKREVEMC